MNERAITMKMISFIVKHKVKQCKCFFGLHKWTEWDYIDVPNTTEERHCKVRGCKAKQEQPHKETIAK
jgi:hypothetical protein